MKNVFVVYAEWYVIVMKPAAKVTFAMVGFASKAVETITNATLTKHA